MNCIILLFLSCIEKSDETKEIKFRLGQAKQIFKNKITEFVKVTLNKIEEIGIKKNVGNIIINHMAMPFDNIMTSSE